jgi:hypothetical protein
VKRCSATWGASKKFILPERMDEKTMTIVTRVLFASALALAAAAPVLADDTAMDHRMDATGKRTPHAMRDNIRDHTRMGHGTDAIASEPADPFEGYGNRYFRDFGIGSQS